MTTLRVVSISGGKDSTACALLALERHPAEEVRLVFADTGNEHEQTLAYVHEYMPSALGIPVHTVRADFTAELRVKKERLMAIANGAPDYVNRPVKYPWTPERAAAAAELLEPTGNPFLDLCLLKGMFPKRTMQFCTEELKIKPMTEYQLELIDRHGPIELWQGVRADESPKRALLPEREDRGGGLTIYRPILSWNVDMVFAYMRERGIEPNALYKQGMARVGCMPCINCGKDEILEISKRFPAEIARIEEWERLVSDSSRAGSATFFPYRGDDADAQAKGAINSVVQWSKTQRGGKTLDMFRSLDEPPACASAYGLCE